MKRIEIQIICHVTQLSKRKGFLKSNGRRMRLLEYYLKCISHGTTPETLISSDALLRTQFSNSVFSYDIIR